MFIRQGYIFFVSYMKLKLFAIFNRIWQLKYELIFFFLLGKSYILKSKTFTLKSLTSLTNLIIFLIALLSKNNLKYMVSNMSSSRINILFGKEYLVLIKQVIL